MTAADLRGPDPDLAIVVAADTVDSIHQPQRVCPAATAHDLKSVIHDLGYPDWLTGSDARGDENEPKRNRKSSSIQATRLAPGTQMKSPSQPSTSGSLGRAFGANALQSEVTPLY